MDKVLFASYNSFTVYLISKINCDEYRSKFSKSAADLDVIFSFT